MAPWAHMAIAKLCPKQPNWSVFLVPGDLYGVSVMVPGMVPVGRSSSTNFVDFQKGENTGEVSKHKMVGEGRPFCDHLDVYQFEISFFFKVPLPLTK